MTATTTASTPVRPGAALGGIGFLSLLIGTFISTYTFSSVNIALPDIARTTGAGTASLQLVMGVYATAFALLLIIGGRLGDAYGRDRLFRLGLVSFLITAVAAGCAPGIGMLIGFRALQGFSAALLVPQILATIQASTTGPARVRAIALFSTFGGLGSAAGQVLGGLLLEADLGGTGWRPVLWFGGLLALLALAGSFAVPHSSSVRHGNDLTGALAIAAAVTALLLPLTLGPAQHWPQWTILLLIAAPVLFALFWQWERRCERRGRMPLVPPKVVRHRAVWIGLVMNFLFFSGYGAFMYEFALLTQRGLGFHPLASGLSLGPFAVAFAVVSVNLTWFTRRLGRWIILIGSLVMIVALLWLAVVTVAGWPAPSQWLWQPALVLLGTGQALVFGPLVGVVIAQVPAEIAGLSGGLFSTTQQASLAFGVAVYGSIYATVSTTLSVPLAFGLCLLVQATTCVGVLALARVVQPGRAAADRSTVH